jgi:hypothetical protein
VKIYKFLTWTLGVHILALLLSFYVCVYIGLHLCVRIVFDSIGYTAIILVQSHCPFLADG